ncbi:hypothetical protein GCK72_015163 [Caenorhabditis remanei]|uniref:Uncharacterized protein n=1 Tax=Caenorhabditis remanei TaxID=31234 RepID=A0A6A5GWB6_CAERE|nr:hypothetical protein GCK72_015163 [Caenorhabditis remanei]KAF1758703.1 hypothetical protein GCK72_015163 [Caenorhabditis remanei]
MLLINMVAMGMSTFGTTTNGGLPGGIFRKCKKRGRKNKNEGVSVEEKYVEILNQSPQNQTTISASGYATGGLFLFFPRDSHGIDPRGHAVWVPETLSSLYRSSNDVFDAVLNHPSKTIQSQKCFPRTNISGRVVYVAMVIWSTISHCPSRRPRSLDGTVAAVSAFLAAAVSALWDGLDHSNSRAFLIEISGQRLMKSPHAHLAYRAFHLETKFLTSGTAFTTISMSSSTSTSTGAAGLSTSGAATGTSGAGAGFEASGAASSIT